MLGQVPSLETIVANKGENYDVETLAFDVVPANKEDVCTKNYTEQSQTEQTSSCPLFPLIFFN